MIEWLSYAAEVTAGLLLISLGFDRAGGHAPKRRHVDHDSNSNSLAEPLRRSLEASRSEIWWLQSQCAILNSSGLESEFDMETSRSTHALLRDLAQQIDRVVPVDQRDSLTALQNQIGFERLVEFLQSGTEVVESHSHSAGNDIGGEEQPETTPLSAVARKGIPIAMFDIDDFKAFNDKNGMENGDGLLCQVAAWLRAELSPIGFIARVQGGKFIAACPFLDAKTAFRLVEKTRTKLSMTPFIAKGQEQFITLSSSLLIRDPQVDLDESLQKLGDGLFHSKSKGKNCGHWWNGENWIGIEQDAIVAATELSTPDIVETEIEPVNESTIVSEAVPAEPESPKPAKERTSQNDIEALLAGAQAIKRDVVPKPVDTKDSAKASNDDIADLFASVKALQAEAEVATQPIASVEPTAEVPKPANTENGLDVPSPSSDYPEPSVSNQPASPDDIAALFAAMRPKA